MRLNVLFLYICALRFLRTRISSELESQVLMVKLMQRYMVSILVRTRGKRTFIWRSCTSTALVAYHKNTTKLWRFTERVPRAATWPLLTI